MDWQQGLVDVNAALSTATPSLQSFIDQLLRIPGASLGGSSSGGGAPPPRPRAAGGILSPFGDWSEVGEQGTEGIVGGRVIPHSEWESMKRIHNLFQQPVGVTIAGGTSYIPIGSKKGGAPQTINIYLGNEKLSSFVLDAVTKELRS